MTLRARKIEFIVFLSAILTTAASLAMEPASTEWPLERIIANLQERLRESPQDAQTLYNLGRAHAFSFALKRSSLWVYDGAPIQIVDLDKQDRKRLPSQSDDPS